LTGAIAPHRNPLQWQGDSKCAPGAWLAFRGNVAAVAFDDGAGDGQSQSEARRAVRHIQSVEAVEDAG